MGTETKKSDYYLIDITDEEELKYIASKLGCQVSDIHSAIEKLNTRKRSSIYSYIIDEIFRSHLT